MSKEKFYKLLSIGLIILNLIILGFFFMKKKGKRLTPKEIIIERLEFSESQILAYDKLIEEHQESIQPWSKEIAAYKNSLYAQLTIETQNTDIIDSLKKGISTAKNNIEDIHYAHFLDIREICTPEQIPKFKELTKEMAQIFAPKRPPGKHKKK